MPKQFCLIETLKAERESRNLDPEALAQSLGLNKHVIKAWEDGKQHPRIKSVVRWANALGFDIQIERRA